MVAASEEPAQAGLILKGKPMRLSSIEFTPILIPSFINGQRGVQFNSGSATNATLATDVGSYSKLWAVSVISTADGGWISNNFVVERWPEADVRLLVMAQATAAATGNVSLEVHWDRSRSGENGISEGSASNVVAGPTNNLDLLELVAGTIPQGTFQGGDHVSIGIRQLGSGLDPANHTYNQTILIARLARFEVA